MNNVSIGAMHKFTKNPTSKIMIRADPGVMQRLLAEARRNIDDDLNLRVAKARAEIVQISGSFYVTIHSAPSRENFARVVNQETVIVNHLKELQRDLLGAT